MMLLPATLLFLFELIFLIAFFLYSRLHSFFSSSQQSQQQSFYQFLSYFFFQLLHNLFMSIATQIL